jgi:hypothetical protein
MAGAGRRVFQPGEVLTASNVMSYLQDQAVMVFDNATERDLALGSAVVSQGMVSYLKDVDELEVYTDEWVNVLSAATPSFRYVSTVYFTSSGTFTKASYPWLRAIKVRCVGGGGGSGGIAATSSTTGAISAGGGGGAYAESFITDISGLADTITVTRGAGGAAGASGANAGASGGTSSFSSSVTAGGGGGGGGRSADATIQYLSNPGAGGTVAVGDLVIPGNAGGSRVNVPGIVQGAEGGASYLGGSVPGGAATASSNAGNNGQLYGGGAGAPCGRDSAARAGASGANGIVIVELYA